MKNKLNNPIRTDTGPTKNVSAATEERAGEASGDQVETKEQPSTERIVRSHSFRCEDEEQEMSEVWGCDGVSQATERKMGLRLLQLHRLSNKSLE